MEPLREDHNHKQMVANSPVRSMRSRSSHSSNLENSVKKYSPPDELSVGRIGNVSSVAKKCARHPNCLPMRQAGEAMRIGITSFGYVLLDSSTTRRKSLMVWETHMELIVVIGGKALLSQLIEAWSPASGPAPTSPPA